MVAEAGCQRPQVEPRLAGAAGEDVSCAAACMYSARPQEDQSDDG